MSEKLAAKVLNKCNEVQALKQFAGDEGLAGIQIFVDNKGDDKLKIRTIRPNMNVSADNFKDAFKKLKKKKNFSSLSDKHLKDIEKAKEKLKDSDFSDFA